jgi:hypothetical protein
MEHSTIAIFNRSPKINREEPLTREDDGIRNLCTRATSEVGREDDRVGWLFLQIRLGSSTTSSDRLTQPRLMLQSPLASSLPQLATAACLVPFTDSHHCLRRFLAEYKRRKENDEPHHDVWNGSWWKRLYF